MNFVTAELVRRRRRRHVAFAGLKLPVPESTFTEKPGLDQYFGKKRHPRHPPLRLRGRRGQRPRQRLGHAAVPRGGHRGARLRDQRPVPDRRPAGRAQGHRRRRRHRRRRGGGAAAGRRQVACGPPASTPAATSVPARPRPGRGHAQPALLRPRLGPGHRPPGQRRRLTDHPGPRGRHDRLSAVMSPATTPSGRGSLAFPFRPEGAATTGGRNGGRPRRPAGGGPACRFW